MSGTDEMPGVAIVGRPNVGKSELFNRLVGRKIAIVHDQPGVTRDRLSGVCPGGAQPFRLWDTGGIGGAGENELTAHVRMAVDAAVRDSQVLLFMVDARHGLSPMDQDLARLVRKSGKPVLLVINKVDHSKHENSTADFDSLGFDKSVSISAAHGRGIADLLDAIDGALGQGTAAFQPPERTSATEKPPAHPSHTALLIAIVGRPNVGKSSLINAITQTERAIVSELPGTTRDAIDISYSKNGDHFVFIDTAGIRKRGRHASSIEVFSVMRSERSIRRANLCILTIDISSGVTVQDKKIAGLIQEARRPAIIVINKFDLLKTKGRSQDLIEQVVEETRRRLFFLDYAPVLVTSALTGEHVDKLFRLVRKLISASKKRIGTGRLNRLLRDAVASNPPPMVSGRRLKLFYATQTTGPAGKQLLQPPEFVLFVNEPRLLGETYRRYLEGQIRAEEPYPGLPIRLTLRPRSEKVARPSRSRSKLRE
ncbi:MAG TPA: ribosome biogenesis GTPase Der [Chthoniobacterales bacterium]|nr:ribosome biogenesis GTPase Der [Chthoniobacterales bacterium]